MKENKPMNLLLSDKHLLCQSSFFETIKFKSEEKAHTNLVTYLAAEQVMISRLGNKWP
jgi:hypothetical protein